ncbi:MAG: hypothetical protein V9G14_01805 [Cypionkella sp.]
MSDMATVELDLAQNVFQVQRPDATGRAVLHKTLRRAQVPGFEKALRPETPCRMPLAAPICGRARSAPSARKRG